MSPLALVDKAVRTKLPIITEAQAQTFYNENKAKLQGSFAKLKGQIVEYLLTQEERKLSLAYAEELRNNGSVQIYLTAPESPSF